MFKKIFFNTRNLTSTFAYLLIFVILLTLGLSLSLQSILASWENPTAAPPGNNKAEPINVGTSTQEKYGAFEVGGPGSLFTASSSAGITGDFSVNNDNLYVSSSFGGRVGIGTDVVGAKLDIDMKDLTNAEGLRISRDAAASHYAYLNILNESGNSIFMVKEDGNVGIGTGSPLSKLQVQGGDIFIRSTANPKLRFGHDDANTWASIYRESATGKLFVRNDQGNAIILDNGNVGIGTTSPGALLDITKLTTQGAHNHMQQWTHNGRYSLRLEQRWKTAGRIYYDYITNNNGLDENAMTIDSNGNIGIGTNDPSVKLDVNGALRISAGSPSYGKVLMSTDATGLATWVATSSLGISGGAPGVSYYMNMGEDYYEYWNTDGGGIGGHASHADSCPGVDNNNPYVCQPNENTSCLDSAANPNSANWPYHHRTVNCRAATVGANPGSQKMTSVARDNWLNWTNRYVNVVNNGDCTLLDNCPTADYQVFAGNCGSYFNWTLNLVGTVGTQSIPYCPT